MNILPGVVTGAPSWIVPLQFGGQNNSPGAAGGNIGGSIHNNTVAFGPGNFTLVNQNNLNSQGGSGNTAGPVVIPVPVQP